MDRASEQPFHHGEHDSWGLWHYDEPPSAEEQEQVLREWEQMTVDLGGEAGSA